MMSPTDERRDSERQPGMTVGWAMPASRPVAVAWEYRMFWTVGGVVVGGDGSLVAVGTPMEQALEIMGRQRWELAAIHAGPDGPAYIFKRPEEGQ